MGQYDYVLCQEGRNRDIHWKIPQSSSGKVPAFEREITKEKHQVCGDIFRKKSAIDSSPFWNHFLVTFSPFSPTKIE